MWFARGLFVSRSHFFPNKQTSGIVQGEADLWKSLLSRGVSAETEDAVSRSAQKMGLFHLYVTGTKVSTGINWSHATNTGPLYVLVPY